MFFKVFTFVLCLLISCVAVVAQEKDDTQAKAQSESSGRSSAASETAIAATALRSSAPADSLALQTALEKYASKLHLGHKNAVGRALIRLDESERVRFFEILAANQEVIGAAEAAQAAEEDLAKKEHIQQIREIERIRAQPRPIIVQQYQNNYPGTRQQPYRRNYNNGGGNNFYNPQLEWIRRNQENYQRWLQYNSNLYRRILGF